MFARKRARDCDSDIIEEVKAKIEASKVNGPRSPATASKPSAARHRPAEIKPLASVKGDFNALAQRREAAMGRGVISTDARVPEEDRMRIPEGRRRMLRTRLLVSLA